MERKNKARAETTVYLLIVAAILVVANVISFRAYKRFDVTRTERFSLSKGSKHLVETLDKDLDVTIYVTRGLAKYEIFIQDLMDLMNEYEHASGGKLHYTVIEPKTEDEKQKAKDDGLQEVTLGEGSKTGKEQLTFSKGYMGISFKYGSEKDNIPFMSPEQSTGLEFWITNKIREVHDRAENKFQKVGVLTGHDEIKLSDANLVPAQGRGGGPSMKQIIENAFPFYKIEDVDLQGGEAEINKELTGIIITQPNKELTEKELRRIDQFLMQGGKSLAVFASAVNLKAADGSMKATLDLHGLDKLLDGYGVEMKKDAVFDWGRPAVMRVQTQGAPVAVAHPALVLAQYDNRADDTNQFLDQSFAGFFRLDELVFPFPSTLVPHADKQPGATFKVIARTTARSGAVTSDVVEMKPPPKQKGELGQHDIAITLEGKLKSAFATKADGIDTPAESKDKSRILVVSSSEFFANPWARSGNAPPMPPQMMMMGQMGGDEELLMISQGYIEYLQWSILSLKNTLDWMGGDSDLLASSAKLNREPSLTYLDVAKPKEVPVDDDAAKKQADDEAAEITKVQQRVQWTMTLLPAALFALLGIALWRAREARRSSYTID